MDALINETLARIQQVHAKIAKDVFPQGGVLKCRECDTQIKFTTKQATEYLTTGWPKHCGKAMRIWADGK